MRVLYLCPRTYVETKMSRGRFHAMEAVRRAVSARGGWLMTWGNGWPGYDPGRTVTENLRTLGRFPDLVVGYMPFEMKGFADVPVTKVMTYNEMYNWPKVSSQLETCRPDLVVCHHANEMPYYAARFPGIRFVNLPHCADAGIFRDEGLERTTDVLVVGRLSSERYPLRTRMSRLVSRLAGRYVCRVHPHPGYVVSKDSTEECVRTYARALNTAKICVTCSGTPRSRYAKYVEIPRCGAVLCADLPGEDQDFFRRFMIEIDASMSDEVILERITRYLENDAERESLRRAGAELSEPFTQEWYASRLLDAVERLQETVGGKGGLRAQAGV